MNAFDKIEKLLYAIKKSSPGNLDGEFDHVNACVLAFTDYHNEAVNQGRILSIMRFKLDDDGFARTVEAMHKKRKAMHMRMIDCAVALNAMCRAYNVELIYEGPLDKNLMRDDPDTRFGVAKFAEQLCHDFFRTTHETEIPESAKQAYTNYANKVKIDGDSGFVLNMMRKTEAKSNMDISAPQNKHNKNDFGIGE